MNLNCKTLIIVLLLTNLFVDPYYCINDFKAHFNQRMMIKKSRKNKMDQTVQMDFSDRKFSPTSASVFFEKGKNLPKNKKRYLSENLNFHSCKDKSECKNFQSENAFLEKSSKNKRKNNKIKYKKRRAFRTFIRENKNLIMKSKKNKTQFIISTIVGIAIFIGKSYLAYKSGSLALELITYAIEKVGDYVIAKKLEELIKEEKKFKDEEIPEIKDTIGKAFSNKCFESKKNQVYNKFLMITDFMSNLENISKNDQSIEMKNNIDKIKNDIEKKNHISYKKKYRSNSESSKKFHRKINEDKNKNITLKEFFEKFINLIEIIKGKNIMKVEDNKQEVKREVSNKNKLSEIQNFDIDYIPFFERDYNKISENSKFKIQQNYDQVQKLLKFSKSSESICEDDYINIENIISKEQKVLKNSLKDDERTARQVFPGFTNLFLKSVHSIKNELTSPEFLKYLVSQKNDVKQDAINQDLEEIMGYVKETLDYIYGLIKEVDDFVLQYSCVGLSEIIDIQDIIYFIFSRKEGFQERKEKLFAKIFKNIGEKCGEITKNFLILLSGQDMLYEIVKQGNNIYLKVIFYFKIVYDEIEKIKINFNKSEIFKILKGWQEGYENLKSINLDEMFTKIVIQPKISLIFNELKEMREIFLKFIKNFLLFNIFEYFDIPKYISKLKLIIEIFNENYSKIEKDSKDNYLEEFIKSLKEGSNEKLSEIFESIKDDLSIDLSILIKEKIKSSIDFINNFQEKLEKIKNQLENIEQEEFKKSIEILTFFISKISDIKKFLKNFDENKDNLIISIVDFFNDIYTKLIKNTIHYFLGNSYLNIEMINTILKKFNEYRKKGVNMLIDQLKENVMNQIQIYVKNTYPLEQLENLEKIKMNEYSNELLEKIKNIDTFTKLKIYFLNVYETYEKIKEQIIEKTKQMGQSIKNFFDKLDAIYKFYQNEIEGRIQSIIQLKDEKQKEANEYLFKFEKIVQKINSLYKNLWSKIFSFEIQYVKDFNIFEKIYDLSLSFIKNGSDFNKVKEEIKKITDEFAKKIFDNKTNEIDGILKEFENIIKDIVNADLIKIFKDKSVELKFDINYLNSFNDGIVYITKNISDLKNKFNEFLQPLIKTLEKISWEKITYFFENQIKLILTNVEDITKLDYIIRNFFKIIHSDSGSIFTNIWEIIKDDVWKLIEEEGMKYLMSYIGNTEILETAKNAIQIVLNPSGFSLEKLKEIILENENIYLKAIYIIKIIYDEINYIKEEFFKGDIGEIWKLGDFEYLKVALFDFENILIKKMENQYQEYNQIYTIIKEFKENYEYFKSEILKFNIFEYFDLGGILNKINDIVQIVESKSIDLKDILQNEEIQKIFEDIKKKLTETVKNIINDKEKFLNDFNDMVNKKLAKIKEYFNEKQIEELQDIKRFFEIVESLKGKLFNFFKIFTEKKNLVCEKIVELIFYFKKKLLEKSVEFFVRKTNLNIELILTIIQKISEFRKKGVKILIDELKKNVIYDIQIYSKMKGKQIAKFEDLQNQNFSLDDFSNIIKEITDIDLVTKIKIYFLTIYKTYTKIRDEVVSKLENVKEKLESFIEEVKFLFNFYQNDFEKKIVEINNTKDEKEKLLYQSFLNLDDNIKKYISQYQNFTENFFSFNLKELNTNLFDKISELIVNNLKNLSNFSKYETSVKDIVSQFSQEIVEKKISLVTQFFKDSLENLNQINQIDIISKIREKAFSLNINLSQLEQFIKTFSLLINKAEYYKNIFIGFIDKIHFEIKSHCYEIVSSLLKNQIINLFNQVNQEIDVKKLSKYFNLINEERGSILMNIFETLKDEVWAILKKEGMNYILSFIGNREIIDIAKNAYNTIVDAKEAYNIFSAQVKEIYSSIKKIIFETLDIIYKEYINFKASYENILIQADSIFKELDKITDEGLNIIKIKYETVVDLIKINLKSLFDKIFNFQISDYLVQSEILEIILEDDDKKMEKLQNYIIEKANIFIQAIIKISQETFSKFHDIFYSKIKEFSDLALKCAPSEKIKTFCEKIKKVLEDFEKILEIPKKIKLLYSGLFEEKELISIVNKITEFMKQFYEKTIIPILQKFSSTLSNLKNSNEFKDLIGPKKDILTIDNITGKKTRYYRIQKEKSSYRSLNLYKISKRKKFMNENLSTNVLSIGGGWFIDIFSSIQTLFGYLKGIIGKIKDGFNYIYPAIKLIVPIVKEYLRCRKEGSSCLMSHLETIFQMISYQLISYGGKIIGVDVETLIKIGESVMVTIKKYNEMNSKIANARLDMDFSRLFLKTSVKDYIIKSNYKICENLDHMQNIIKKNEGNNYFKQFISYKEEKDLNKKIIENYLAKNPNEKELLKNEIKVLCDHQIFICVTNNVIREILGEVQMEIYENTLTYGPTSDIIVAPNLMDAINLLQYGYRIKFREFQNPHDNSEFKQKMDEEKLKEMESKVSDFIKKSMGDSFKTNLEPYKINRIINSHYFMECIGCSIHKYVFARSYSLFNNEENFDSLIKQKNIEVGDLLKKNKIELQYTKTLSYGKSYLSFKMATTGEDSEISYTFDGNKFDYKKGQYDTNIEKLDYVDKNDDYSYLNSRNNLILDPDTDYKFESFSIPQCIIPPKSLVFLTGDEKKDKKVNFIFTKFFKKNDPKYTNIDPKKKFSDECYIEKNEDKLYNDFDLFELDGESLKLVKRENKMINLESKYLMARLNHIKRYNKLNDDKFEDYISYLKIIKKLSPQKIRIIGFSFYSQSSKVIHFFQLIPLTRIEFPKQIDQNIFLQNIFNKILCGSEDFQDKNLNCSFNKDTKTIEFLGDISTNSVKEIFTNKQITQEMEKNLTLYEIYGYTFKNYEVISSSEYKNKKKEIKRNSTVFEDMFNQKYVPKLNFPNISDNLIPPDKDFIYIKFDIDYNYEYYSYIDLNNIYIKLYSNFDLILYDFILDGNILYCSFINPLNVKFYSGLKDNFISTYGSGPIGTYNYIYHDTECKDKFHQNFLKKKYDRFEIDFLKKYYKDKYEEIIKDKFHDYLIKTSRILGSYAKLLNYDNYEKIKDILNLKGLIIKDKKLENDYIYNCKSINLYIPVMIENYDKNKYYILSYDKDNNLILTTSSIGPGILPIFYIGIVFGKNENELTVSKERNFKNYAISSLHGFNILSYNNKYEIDLSDFGNENGKIKVSVYYKYDESLSTERKDVCK